MNRCVSSCLSRVVVVATVFSMCPIESLAQFTPYWFDGFDVSANSSDINFEIGVPRQGGVAVPTTYTANSNDYHLQMFGGGGPLQLAGDGFGPFPAHTMASPDLNFVGTAGDDIIGKKISVTMDAFTNNLGGSYFTQAAITVGGSAQLQQSGVGDGFSVVFIEDTFGGNGNFIQTWHGGNLTNNLIPNPAGAGPGNVEILVNDPSDGDPWDGVGSTVFDVFVNGTQIDLNNPITPGLSYAVGGGGLTSNFITLEGSDQKAGVQLGVHVFDNLTVFTAPIPEPSSLAIAGLALAVGGLFVRTRSSR